MSLLKKNNSDNLSLTFVFKRVFLFVLIGVLFYPFYLYFYGVYYLNYSSDFSASVAAKFFYRLDNGVPYHYLFALLMLIFVTLFQQLYYRERKISDRYKSQLDELKTKNFMQIDEIKMLEETIQLRSHKDTKDHLLKYMPVKSRVDSSYRINNKKFDALLTVIEKYLIEIDPKTPPSKKVLKIELMEYCQKASIECGDRKARAI